MNKKTIILTVLVIALLAGAGVWKWKNEPLPEPKEQVQNDQSLIEPTQETSIDTSSWETYRNEEFRFEVKLPSKISYEAHVNKIEYEVGQKDKCQNCELIQFVVPTKDSSRCAFPLECGKAILFVVWVRDISSWEKNYLNKSYACIDSSKIIARTNNYVYNLCPFEVTEDEKKYEPSDIVELLDDTLPIIKSSFIAY